MLVAIGQSGQSASDVVGRVMCRSKLDCSGTISPASYNGLSFVAFPLRVRGASGSMSRWSSGQWWSFRQEASRHRSEAGSDEDTAIVVGRPCNSAQPGRLQR